MDGATVEDEMLFPAIPPWTSAGVVSVLRVSSFSFKELGRLVMVSER